MSAISLSQFFANQVDSVQVVDRKTLKPRRVIGIRAFINKHGNVLMCYSDEGGYYHNAEAVEGFTSIILKVRKHGHV